MIPNQQNQRQDSTHRLARVCKIAPHLSNTVRVSGDQVAARRVYNGIHQHKFLHRDPVVFG